VDPRAGLDNVEKRKFLTLSGLELRPLGRPARSQSLSQLLQEMVDLKKHEISQFYRDIGGGEVIWYGV
jgi:hypothetical protein